jgi:hypothetical protein
MDDFIFNEQSQTMDEGKLLQVTLAAMYKNLDTGREFDLYSGDFL